METASLASTAEPIVVTTLPPGFDDLYEHHADAVYQTALRVMGNAADAEDVLQNVFLRILDHGLTIDPNRSPAAYLRRAATNASIDLLRRKSVLPVAVMEEGRDYASRESGSKEDTVLRKERLRRALAKIPADDAELFVLCYLEGYSYEELATLLDLERGTVASRLHRIRAILRTEMSR
jgi:RNA polymerase sigma-70 factor (ECF subfamily)